VLPHGAIPRWRIGVNDDEGNNERSSQAFFDLADNCITVHQKTRPFFRKMSDRAPFHYEISGNHTTSRDLRDQNHESQH
jgi:hypothetical protein